MFNLKPSDLIHIPNSDYLAKCTQSGGGWFQDSQVTGYVERDKQKRQEFCAEISESKVFYKLRSPLPYHHMA